jgi:putative transposase
MKRHRRSPSQAFRKVREGDRMLGEGQNLTEALRILEVPSRPGPAGGLSAPGMKGEDMERLKELADGKF